MNSKEGNINTYYLNNLNDKSTKTAYSKTDRIFYIDYMNIWHRFGLKFDIGYSYIQIITTWYVAKNINKNCIYTTTNSINYSI